MAKSKLIKLNDNISKSVQKCYGTIRDIAIASYEHIENTVVGAYKKIESAFVDRYLTRDGETVNEARARIKK